MRHRTSNKPGKSAGANSFANGNGEFAGNAYRKLRRGLTHTQFLPE